MLIKYKKKIRRKSPILLIRVAYLSSFFECANSLRWLKNKFLICLHSSLRNEIAISTAANMVVRCEYHVNRYTISRIYPIKAFVINETEVLFKKHSKHCCSLILFKIYWGKRIIVMKKPII